MWHFVFSVSPSAFDKLRRITGVHEIPRINVTGQNMNLFPGKFRLMHTVESGYNDIDSYDTLPRQSDFLWCELIRHC
jgi:hypothetical protein